jgi:urea transport system permease protein
MFGDYSIGDLGSIFVMQGFAGLILFSVYVLMALGLAIIFGQMGVINMAHGEFMILGAYVTWLTSNFFQHYLPGCSGYFFLAMMLAFLASGALGMLVEWALIRHLYKRPLDTLLATWGLSLILQQTYRSVFGAREVGVELPQWMLGSLKVTDSIEVPINGVFVMGLTVLITVVVATSCTNRAGAARSAPSCRTASWPAPSASTPRRSTATPSASAAASPASPAAPSP